LPKEELFGERRGDGAFVAEQPSKEPVDKDAPLSDFERIAPAYLVFRVTAPASA
jgi:hypothetical protein